MMLLMMAAELVATGAWEMFWFQGLSAGNRFELSSEPRAVAIGIAMAQLKTKPPTNCILHQQAILRLSHIGEERATRAGGLWGLRCRLTVDLSGGSRLSFQLSAFQLLAGPALNSPPSTLNPHQNMSRSGQRVILPTICHTSTSRSVPMGDLVSRLLVRAAQQNWPEVRTMTVIVPGRLPICHQL